MTTPKAVAIKTIFDLLMEGSYGFTVEQCERRMDQDLVGPARARVEAVLYDYFADLLFENGVQQQVAQIAEILGANPRWRALP